MGVLVAGQSDQLSATVLMSHVTAVDNVPITKASMSTISYEVWNITTQNKEFQSTNQQTLTINDVVFDTPVKTAVDARWDPAENPDDVGYNFKFDLPSSALPDFGFYHVDVKFTPVAGDIVWAKFEIRSSRTFHDGLP